jgi:hypothetical protein
VVSGLTDSATAGGILLIGLGAVLVVLAAFFVGASDEPDDAEPGLSFPDGLRGQKVVAVPHPDPAMPDGPPGEGWWRASDDQWDPPEQHPDARGEG